MSWNRSKSISATGVGDGEGEGDGGGVAEGVGDDPPEGVGDPEPPGAHPARRTRTANAAAESAGFEGTFMGVTVLVFVDGS